MLSIFPYPLTSLTLYDYLLSLISGGNVLPYKYYSALLTQSGTSAPTVTVLGNNTGLTFTWIRNSSGQYYGTIAEDFNINKTMYFIQDNYSNLSKIIAYIGGGSNELFVVQTSLEGTNSDDILLSTPIEIRIYP